MGHHTASSQPVTTTVTTTHTHSGGSTSYVMPTVNQSLDTHTGSHSEWTTVTAPTIDQNVVDLSGTKNTGTQIFGTTLMELPLYKVGSSYYHQKPSDGIIQIADCNLGPCLVL